MGQKVKERDAAKVANTLLAGSTFISQRQSNASMPEEPLACVVDPDEIGKYNWGEYVLEQIKITAEELQKDLDDEAQVFILGACNLFPEIWYVDWVDFGDQSENQTLLPRIAAYIAEKLKELTKLALDNHKGLQETSDGLL